MKIHQLIKFLFFAEINLCLPNPCKNGATCTERTGGRYECTCPIGYKGVTCEGIDTDKYLNYLKTLRKRQAPTNIYWTDSLDSIVFHFVCDSFLFFYPLGFT